MSRAARYEQCAVGALLADPALCNQIGELTSSHFLSGYSRTAFTAIEKIISEGRTADIGSVIAELGESVPPGYVGECISTAMPEQFSQYKREVLNADKDRRFASMR